MKKIFSALKNASDSTMNKAFKVNTLCKHVFHFFKLFFVSAECYTLSTRFPLGKVVAEASIYKARTSVTKDFA